MCGTRGGYSPALSNSPRQRSVSPDTVIQSTRAVTVNGSNKTRSRRPSVEELNQSNAAAVNGTTKLSDPVILEESDVEMDGDSMGEKKANGVQNGSSHPPDWGDSEDMGT